jgi:hypothetical protein
MKNRDKTVKLLKSFLSDKEVEGVCGYMVDPDGEGPIQVIVVLDINYIKEANTKPGFIAKMIREGVKQEIKKWLNIDVYVGSTAKSCGEGESLIESKKKYIVTESQYNLILESKKYWQVFEDLIQKEIEYIRKECEVNMIDYADSRNDEHCNQLENIEKIVVTDADWMTIMHSNQPLEQKYMSIKLMVYYFSLREFGDFDADDITYELEKRLRKSTGMPLIINYESTNTNTSFEW